MADPTIDVSTPWDYLSYRRIMTRFVSFAFEVVSICHKMLRLSIRIIGAAYKDCLVIWEEVLRNQENFYSKISNFGKLNNFDMKELSQLLKTFYPFLSAGVALTGLGFHGKIDPLPHPKIYVLGCPELKRKVKGP